MRLILSIDGIEMRVENIPESYLADIDRYTQAENFDARERIIQMYANNLYDQYRKMAHLGHQVSIHLAAPSKMNDMSPEQIDKLLNQPL